MEMSGGHANFCSVVRVVALCACNDESSGHGLRVAARAATATTRAWGIACGCLRYARHSKRIGEGNWGRIPIQEAAHVGEKSSATKLDSDPNSPLQFFSSLRQSCDGCATL